LKGVSNCEWDVAMEADHKHIYIRFMKHFYMFTFKKMATVQIFEVVSDKFNVVKWLKLSTEMASHTEMHKKFWLENL
jgi:hypothetical protein